MVSNLRVRRRDEEHLKNRKGEAKKGKREVKKEARGRKTQNWRNGRSQKPYEELLQAVLFRC